MKRLVISAVNFTEGGPLSVLRDCLTAAADHLGSAWEITALVHDENLIEIPGIRLIAFPRAKRSWLARLYYEWWYFSKLSKEIRPHLWLSLHDITPRVTASRRAVYCHNPSPFYDLSFKDGWLDPSFLAYNLFYRYLYSINIQKNHSVIVQQEWLRNEFKRLFMVKNVIVAHPSIPSVESTTGNETVAGPYVFFYPALPRVFKNMEVICEAAALVNVTARGRFEVRMTIDGRENRYAAMLAKRYAGVPGVRFIGKQSRREIFRQYARCGCVIFPSRLETWGLPITEAKAHGKPILAADLPYAHETVGECEAVAFFDPKQPHQLASHMLNILNGRPPFSAVTYPLPAAPFARDWNALLDQLVEGM